MRVLADRDFASTADVVLVSVGVQPNSAGARPSRRCWRCAQRARRHSGRHCHGDDTARRLGGGRLRAHPPPAPSGADLCRSGRRRITGPRRRREHCRRPADLRRLARHPGREGLDLAIAEPDCATTRRARPGSSRSRSQTSAPDHKPYYPRRPRAAHALDRRPAQWPGCWACQTRATATPQVAERVDIPAAAISADLAVDQFSDLDLSYTPPISMPCDALQLGAQTWTAELEPKRASTVVASHQEQPQR